MVDLSDRIAALSPEQRALLQRRLAESVETSQSNRPKLTRRNAAIAPLSFAQQRIWFLDQFEPESSLYNVPSAMRLSGTLDFEALERSLEELVRRHESLRTTFSLVDGDPVQVIHDPSGFHLEVVDLSALDECRRRQDSDRLIQEEAQRPFDLKRGPVLRASLLRLAADEHILLLTLHHIVSDGWSQGVLRKELSALYSAFRDGRPSPLQELTLQYADYAAWQRNWLQSEVLQRQIDYWKQNLDGAPTLLELPTDRARPPVQSYRGALRRFEYSSELLSGIKALGRHEGASLFMTLLAAFQVLLARYSGQDDIVVGTPIANRSESETEGLIGFFMNTLALRLDLSRDPSFRQLLSRVRTTALGAYGHQDLPFEKLVEELQPERSRSRPPLFQVMFTLQNAAGGAMELQGLCVEGAGTVGSTAKFDLTLGLSDRSDRLFGWLEYNTDLFDEDRMERLLGHYQTLLESIVSNPDQKVSSLPLLTQPERERLSVEWNATHADLPIRVCLHQRIEDQVDRTPDAIALCFENEALTYSQLDKRANQLAHLLRHHGVGPDVLVGLCVERSIEMVVGLLGIMKAGGAYVPLDPSYPSERLAHIRDDAGISVVLTQHALLATLPSWDGTVLCLDSEWPTISLNSEHRPVSGVDPDNLAYVIYTSGSTGKPKGAMNSHRGICNRLLWMQHAYGLSSSDRVLQKTPYSFDVSVWEFFWPLMVGASLVVAAPELHRDAAGLVDLIRSSQITTLHFVPSMLQVFLDERSACECTSIRRVICSGEALPAAMVNQFGSVLPAELHNLYGPTEAAVDVSYWQCPTDGSVETVPIGRPVWNTHLYVLDRNLCLVPVGVPGELYLGGVQLARGYLKRPDLTAERFVPDPFSAQAGARLYKTGDLVKYLPDGNVEYLGRLDHQVKIRGFRIELGEIESALLSHAGVREAVVLAREDTPGDKRIVAYIVTNDGTVNVGVVRAYLQEKLPGYMVPAAFLHLDSLPLTPNGKVDRKALPAPDASSVQADEYTAPRTPVEEGLVEIWGAVLHTERVGVHDSFFELGGHSLLATQVISRIRNTFQTELPLRALFEAPTVAALAERIEAAFGEENTAIPLLVRASREKPLPLSFAQQRLWFLDQFEPGSSLYTIPSVMRLTGTMNVGALEQSIEELVRRHESLRTTFSLVDGDPVQVIHEPSELRLDVLDLSDIEEAERDKEAQRYIQEDAQRPFDLQQGPLFRSGLLRLRDEEHILLLTLHHIVSDGWSQGVLRRELSTLYNGFCQGEPCRLPELPIQYADYAAWQRQRLQGDALERHIGYWRQNLSGAPTLLELPTDRPRPPVQSFNGARVRFEISAELTKGLRRFGLREGATLYMTLLAAFQVLLSRYSGQDDIVVGTPIANRTQSETEGLIGFFVNTLALRGDLSGDPNFRQLLARVRETALGAYAHQDLPFEKLVEELQPERSMTHSPIFQVVFTLQALTGVDIHLTGLDVSGCGEEGVSAKFDLGLGFSESGEMLRGALEYNTDLFDADRVNRMVGHLQTLLQELTNSPDQKISCVQMLTAQERRQLLIEWNDTRAAIPDCRLHHLVESQVDRSPDATAVSFEGQSLSYRELDERANRLAHYLRSKGICSGAYIGVAMERSVELVVALLGVLKAGAAYVPIDPEYPRERVNAMLQDAQVPLIISQGHLAASLPQQAGVIIFIDHDWGAISIYPCIRPDIEVDACDPAYVIYTSGSTGRAKGVVIPHQAIVNHTYWVDQTFPLTTDDRLLQKTPISFDASVFEFWAPLVTGAELVMAQSGAHRDPAYLVRTIRERRITLIVVVPSLLQILLEEDGFAECDSLRWVICGGEAVTCDLRNRFFAQFGNAVALHNLYGPTEAAVDSTSFVCQANRDDRVVPIGRPLPNMQAYVLDGNSDPLPVGVPGELFVGGVQLAQGYLHRADLTAERFVPHPFSTEPGARIYKTGDLCRYLSDGNIEYLGRLDHQVKMRGFRIELGEIESALLSHAGVREAVVLVREDTPGDKRLVGYIVCEETSEPQPRALQEYLKQTLPEYMVPAAYVILETLPHTPNGKVDRKALPAPDASAVQADEYTAPRTPIEEGLAEIWGAVLRTERVGVYDSFFELGGHSLLATQVISRIRNTFQTELPLRALFEAPTIAALAERIEAVFGEENAASPLLVRASREKPLPLSFAQQRLWFLDQFEPGSSLYTIPSVMRLTGTMNVGALEQSIEELVRRHESLRTTFSLVDGDPVQVIHEPSELRLDVLDLSDIEEAERDKEAQRYIQEDAQRPFDLQQGPLFRSGLLRLRDEEHILLLTLHHIVSDGWSQGLLRRELSALYNGFCQGEPCRLPELPIQYADYAAWQRQRLQGDALERHIGYWRQNLSGAPTLLELPTDRPRPPVQGYRGALKRFEFSPELLNEIKTLGQRQGTTLFMTLLAAFQVLLSRCSGQDDIVVGTPIANRTQSETEGLIGFFMNTLALRGDLSGDPSFRELLLRVRDTALGAYAHQDLPFEKLVEELRPERSLSHSPLFQVLLIVQNAAGGAMNLEGLQVCSVGSGNVSSKFDLTIGFSEADGKLFVALEYNTDLFDEERIERMVVHFQTLLEGITANPDEHISFLPLLTQSERDQLLVKWNATSRNYPSELCVHTLFEEQVRRTPEAIAVDFEGNILTYTELNSRANQLSHYLQKQGVSPDVLVGLCVGRSLEMVVGLLGILKAGGAYVPLDPAWPIDRLRLIAVNSRLALVITQSQVEEALPAELSARLYLDRDQHLLDQESSEPVVSSVLPNHLAYVLHTSGSTGVPKGVQITHRAVVNFLCSMGRQPGLTSSDTVLAVTTISFDIAGLELWLPLLVGARVVIASQDAAMDGDLLSGLLQSSGATMMQATPATWRMLLASGWSGQSGLKVLCGGEGLPDDLAGSLLPSCSQLWNLYGPTETTIWSCVEQIVSADRISIGRPIDNTQMYVLDRNLTPVPVGILGALYIAGDGLSRGYLNRSDLTAEQFVPDPFCSSGGRRMYRTGDVARYLPDGRLECLGRLDHQVKVRGFRIELGEIESALLSYKSISSAVVIVREDTPGDKRLVAYLVSNDGVLHSEELRTEVMAKLPGYMVPAAFVFLESLPLTPNGKVDRKALPAPDTNASLQNTYVAPRTETEASVEEIWRTVLLTDQIGIQESFFALGGHSLLAAQVVSRIRSTFRIELPLRALFEAPTIAGLSDRIEVKRRENQGLASTLPLQRISKDEPLPLSFAQQRLWFMDQLQPGTSLLNVPMAMELRGKLELDALQFSLDTIQSRHEVLRTVFGIRRGIPVQLITEHRPVAINVVDVGPTPDDRRSQLAEQCVKEAALKPFDLEHGPVYRCDLFRIAAEVHIVVITLHHIACDGTSVSILLNELTELYRAAITGRQPVLSVLPIQYADYAVWQRNRFKNGEFQSQIAYWTQQLRNAPPVLEIPTDNPRPSTESFARGCCRFLIGEDTFRNVVDLCSEEKATPFMYYLAVYNILLSRRTGRTDILVGTDTLNRDRPETSDLIGFFINQLVLRTDLTGCVSFRQLLRRVRDVALEGYINQELPFDQLVEQLHPLRDPQHPPIFQVKLLYTSGYSHIQDLEGLSVRSLPVDRGVAQLDQIFWLQEQAGRVYGQLEYKAELYHARSIERIVHDYEKLVTACSDDPDLSLDEYECAAVAAPSTIGVQERMLTNRDKLLGTLVR